MALFTNLQKKNTKTQQNKPAASLANNEQNYSGFLGKFQAGNAKQTQTVPQYEDMPQYGELPWEKQQKQPETKTYQYGDWLPGGGGFYTYTGDMGKPFEQDYLNEQYKNNVQRLNAANKSGNKKPEEVLRDSFLLTNDFWNFTRETVALHGQAQKNYDEERNQKLLDASSRNLNSALMKKEAEYRTAGISAQEQKDQLTAMGYESETERQQREEEKRKQEMMDRDSYKAYQAEMEKQRREQEKKNRDESDRVSAFYENLPTLIEKENSGELHFDDQASRDLWRDAVDAMPEDLLLLVDSALWGEQQEGDLEQIRDWAKAQAEANRPAAQETAETEAPAADEKAYREWLEAQGGADSAAENWMDWAKEHRDQRGDMLNLLEKMADKPPVQGSIDLTEDEMALWETVRQSMPAEVQDAAQRVLWGNDQAGDREKIKEYVQQTADMLRGTADVYGDLPEYSEEIKALLNQYRQTPEGAREHLEDVKGTREEQQARDNLYFAENRAKYAKVPQAEDFEENSKFIEKYAQENNHYAEVNGQKIKFDPNRTMAVSMAEAKNTTGMTEQQKKIYNYLYNTQGAVEAEKYLDYLQYELNAIQAEQYAKDMKDMAGMGVGGAAAASVLSVPANALRGLGFLDVAGQRIRNLAGSNYRPIDRNSAFNQYGNIADSAREGVMENYDWQMNILGRDVDLFDFIYGTGMSAVDSLGMGSAGPKAGAVLLGLSSAQSTMQDIYDREGSDEQALLGGLVAGIFESLFEELSLGKFYDEASHLGKDSFKDWFINIAAQTGINASEEFFTECANIAYDYFANGDKSEFNKLVEYYKEHGLDEGNQAEARAFWDKVYQALEAGAGGALMGNWFGFISSAKSSSATKAIDKTAGKSIIQADTQQALKDIGMTMPEGSKARKAAESFQPGKAKAKDVGALYREIYTMLSGSKNLQQAMKDRMTRDVAAKMTSSAAADGGAAASAIVSLYSGEEITPEQAQAIAQNQGAMAAMRELMGVEDAKAEEAAPKETKTEEAQKETDEVAEAEAEAREAEGRDLFAQANAAIDARRQTLEDKAVNGQVQTANRQQEAAPAEERETGRNNEARRQTLEDKAVNGQVQTANQQQEAAPEEERETGRNSEARRQVLEDKMVNRQGQTVREEEATPTEQRQTGQNSEARRQVLEDKMVNRQPIMEVKAEGKPAQVETVTEDRDGGVTVRLADGQEKSLDEIDADDNQKELLNQSSSLPAEDAPGLVNNYQEGQDAQTYGIGYKRIYNGAKRGQTLDEIHSVFGKSELTDAQQRAAWEAGKRAAARAQQAAAQKNAALAQKEGFQTLDAENGKQTGVIFAGVTKALSKSARKQLQMIDLFAKAHGLQVRVYDTLGEDNGSYKTGTNIINVALDADAGALTRTVSHEGYHFLKNWNAEAAQKIQALVIDTLRNTEGYDLDRRVKAIMDKYGLKEDDALEEITADAMLDVIGKEDTLNRLLKEDKGLARKILDWLADVIGELRGMLEKLGKYNPEVKAMLGQQIETLEGLQSQYLDGLQKAEENYRAAQEGATRSAQEDQNVKDYMEAMKGGEDRQTALNGLISQLFFTTQREWLQAHPDADLDEALQRFADALMQYRKENTALRPILENAGFAAPRDMTALSYAADQLVGMERDSGEEVEVKTSKKENVDTSEETLEKNKNTIINMKPVSNLQGDEVKMHARPLFQQVAEIYDKQGWFAENPELGTVELEEGVKESFSHGMGGEKAAAYAAVKPVIENGKLVDYQYNYENKGHDRALIAAPITMGGKDYFMGVLLRRYKENQRFYVHEVWMQEKDSIKQEPHQSQVPGDQSGLNLTRAPVYIKSILQDLAKRKRENDSKTKRSKKLGIGAEEVTLPSLNLDPAYAFKGTDAEVDAADRKVADRQAEIRDIIQAPGFRGLQITKPNGQTEILTPSIRPGVKWQLSYYGTDGIANMHENYGQTGAEPVNEAIHTEDELYRHFANMTLRRDLTMELLGDDTKHSRKDMPQEADNSEESKTLRNKAVEIFGTTYNWNVTGYLLPDGKRLDFSGKREGSSGQYREEDHRAIQEAYGEDADIGGTEAMIDFMRRGAIRIMPESGGIQMQTIPTKAQLQALDSFISKMRGEVTIDIDDAEGNTILSKEYDRGTFSRTILADIPALFEQSTMSQSETARFHNEKYSRKAENVVRDVEEDAALYAQVQSDRDAREALGLMQRLDQTAQETARGQWEKRLGAIADKVLAESGSGMSRQGLMKYLRALYNAMDDAKMELGEKAMYARKAAQALLRQAGTLLEADDSVNEARRLIRTRGFFLTDDQKSEIANTYGSVRAYMRKNFGKMAIRAKGSTTMKGSYLSLTDLWSELHDVLPGTFQMDVTEADMPGILDAFLESTGNRDYSAYYGADAEAFATDLAYQMMLEYYDVPDALKGAQQLRREFRQKLEDWRSGYKQKQADRMQASKEKQAATERRRQLRDAIARDVKYISIRNVAPTDSRHIPAGLRDAAIQAVLPFTNANGVWSGGKLAQVYMEYQALNDGRSANLDAARMYDEDIAAKLETLQRTLDGRRLSELTEDELRDIKDILGNLKKIITETNEMHVQGRRTTLEAEADRFMDELGRRKQITNKALQKLNDLTYKNMTPAYYADKVGGVIKEMAADLMEGQNQWAFTMKAAKEKAQEIAKKYNLNEWINDPEHLRFETQMGDEIELDRRLALSLYATWKRETTNRRQNANHLRIGGFMYGKDAKFDGVDTQKPHTITARDMEEIKKYLGKEQMDYADAMVDYLSHDMAKLGNETSMNLYGYEKFGEAYYFPYSSDRNFLTTELTDNSADMPKQIKNAGMTKATVRNASNPIVIGDFLDVWANHVNQMALYHAFAETTDNLNRIYNYRTPGQVKVNSATGEETVIGPRSVKLEMEKMLGKGAVEYLQTLVKDINGGVAVQDRTGMGKALSLFKKGSVAANASVTLQQPSAIMRAMNMIAPKYFLNQKPAQVKQCIREMGQYSGVAIIKDMGRFDTGTGRSGVEWLNDYVKEGNKLKQAYNAMDKLSGWAPELADRVTWANIWQACKNEVAAKMPGIDADHEAYMQAVAARFNDVVNHTQVYDSTLSKSSMMRSQGMFDKLATSFMAEPTVAFNMLLQAVENIRQPGGKAKAARAMGAFVAAAILNSLLKSLVTAGRRKDDDERTIIEKYLAEVVENAGDDLSLEGIIGLVPIARDAVSIFQGYDVYRSDMDVVQQFYDAYKTLKNEKKTFWDKTKAVAGAVGNATGVPVKNVVRDVEGMLNLFRSAPIGETSGRDIKYSMLDSLPGGWGLFWDDSRGAYYRRINAAAERGDTEAAEEMRGYMQETEGVKEQTMNTGLRTAAKEDMISGRRSEEDTVKLLTGFLGMGENDAYFKLKEWQGGEEYKKYGDLTGAIERGDGISEAVKELMDHGVKKETISSQITQEFKPKYIELSKTNPVAAANLKAAILAAYQALGYDRNKKNKDIDKWLEEKKK